MRDDAREVRLNGRHFKQHDLGCYLPTQSEIREKCLAIQETWSPREEASRRNAVFESPWGPPVAPSWGER